MFQAIELVPVSPTQAIRRPDGYLILSVQNGALIGLVRIKEEGDRYLMGRIMMRKHSRYLAAELLRLVLRQRAKPAQ